MSQTAVVQLPDGRKAQIQFESPDQLDAAVSDLVAHSQQQPSALESGAQSALQVAAAPVEAAANVASSAVAAPVAGLAGLANGVYQGVKQGISQHSFKEGLDAGINAGGDTVRGVQDALTYQPRGEMSQKLANAATYPFQLLAKGADAAGGAVTDMTGSPLAGAITNTAIQAGPGLLLHKVGGGPKGAPEALKATPEQAAQDYVSRSTSLDWSSLADKTKQTLTSIAQDSQKLGSLDPKAVERQARLDALDLPATRGQVTRDLPQLTREENITKTDAGQPIRDINAAQDQRLHGLIDQLRKNTGATAETRQGVGNSVQGALREKIGAAKKQASAAYDFANKVGETESVTTDALNQFLKNPINKANVGWVASRLDDLKNPDGTISLKNLEDVRQELTRAAKTPDKGGHYAGEAASVIDSMMDDAGSSAYKNARASWKAMKDEFDKQGRIKKLVTQKGYTSDRAVALEDTFDNVVLRGSAEDIAKVKKSLTTGGDPKTQGRGMQAWKDLQAATLDYLKEKAAGKRAIVGEQNQLQFNSSFRDAFNELEKDGKIDAVFSPQQASMLRKINDAVGDVRTKPAGRVAGSDTTPRLLAMLEKVSKLPVIGDVAAGSVKAVNKLREMGKESKDVAQAMRSPLDEAAQETKRQQLQKQSSLQKQKALKEVAPFAPATQERRR